MKHVLLTVGMYVVVTAAHAQSNPLALKQHAYGGSMGDWFNSMCLTKDGGCVMGGGSNSNDGDATGNHGQNDYWIVKAGATGTTQWTKSLGGSLIEWQHDVQQTKDGGYIVAGESYSNDSNVSGNHGTQDAWIVKLNATGNIQWQRSLGGSDYDYANCVRQTNDGGYIVGGSTYSKDGDVSGNHGQSDMWIVKLDASGNIQWQKCFGGTKREFASSIRQTKDGGYIIAGSSGSVNGDVTVNHGLSDYWIIKLDASANIQWQKSFGGTNDENAKCVEQITDGSYIVAGYCNSADSDINDHHGVIKNDDYWVLKLDTSGNIQWKKSFGGSRSDDAFSIKQTKDKGYIIAGESFSLDGDVTGQHSVGYSDFWVVKTDGLGNIQWQRTLGGSDYDGATDVRQIANGGYIVCGHISSTDGDVTGSHSSGDGWVVKLSASGNLINEQTVLATNSQLTNHPVNQLSIFPNPVASVLHITGLSLNMKYELRVMNESGTVIQRASVKNISSYDMDLSKLPQGIYYLQAGNEKIKFIKNN